MWHLIFVECSHVSILVLLKTYTHCISLNVYTTRVYVNIFNVVTEAFIWHSKHNNNDIYWIWHDKNRGWYYVSNVITSAFMPYSKPVLRHLIAVLRNTVRQGLLAISLDVIARAFVQHFKPKTTVTWSLKHSMTRFKSDFTVFRCNHIYIHAAFKNFYYLDWRDCYCICPASGSLNINCLYFTYPMLCT